jgi:RHS repeat-associated protein
VSVPEFFFVYDEAGHLIGKYDGSGNLLQETAWLGDLPVTVLEPAGQFYIAPDHLGAPHQITDAGGATVWLWHPDPFGKGDPSGTFSYDLRFPGQFFDQATHLHYNYFRDYDPRLGRYIESDPIGLAGGINTYAYAGGNPAGNIDPSGLGPFGLPIKFIPEPPFVVPDPIALSPPSFNLAFLTAQRQAEVIAYEAARKLLKLQVNALADASNNATARIDNGFVQSPGNLGPGGGVGPYGGLGH